MPPLLDGRGAGHTESAGGGEVEGKAIRGGLGRGSKNTDCDGLAYGTIFLRNYHGGEGGRSKTALGGFSKKFVNIELLVFSEQLW